MTLIRIKYTLIAIPLAFFIGMAGWSIVQQIIANTPIGTETVMAKNNDGMDAWPRRDMYTGEFVK